MEELNNDKVALDEIPLLETIDFLGSFASSISERKQRAYYQIPFTPEAITGLHIHRYLSSYPHNFVTDGIAIYQEAGPQPFPVAENAILYEDLVREDIVVYIIDANPPHLNVFENNSGRYAYAAFPYAFQGRDPQSEYARKLDVLTNKHWVIRDSEKKLVRNRVQANKRRLTMLLAGLAAQESCQQIHMALARHLKEYGLEE